MKILFIRHGESQSNTGAVKASSPDHINGLTKEGETQIKKIAKSIPYKIDAIYASPYNRTIVSGNIFIDNRSEKLELKVDDRLREINYGIYTNDRNNPEMERIAKRQIADDYEIRFSDSGENKREIITRFMSFLLRLIDEQKINDTIVVFSHGRAISILEYEFAKLTNSRSSHIHTSNGSINQINLKVQNREILEKFIVKLNKKEISERLNVVNKIINKSTEKQAVETYKNNLIKIAKNNLDEIDLSREVLSQFANGLFSSKISAKKCEINQKILTKNDIVLLVVFKNATNFIKHFIDHYKKIGIKYFVFINNDSDDNSINIIYDNSQDVLVDVWCTKDRFDAIKAMGWKQRLMVYYGLDHWYLNLDIDELLVFNGIEQYGIEQLIHYATENNLSTVGSVMLDMYPNMQITQVNSIPNEKILEYYCYYDKDTYQKVGNQKYENRIFGGPRMRSFDIAPSLQKYPLIYPTRDSMGINPHFWYPYRINMQSRLVSALLHYKFLPHDFSRYVEYTKTGVHYNNSSEYKKYIETIQKNPKLNFYNKNYSVKYQTSADLKNIKIIEQDLKIKVK